jgi:hypothetical protein
MLHLPTNRRAAIGGAALLVLGLAACTSNPPDHQTQKTSTTAAPTGSPTGGFTPAGQESPLGAHWDMNRVTSFASYLESVRGSATFHEVVWCKLEPTQGKRDWRSVDEVADAAQQHGITLSLKIRVGACWATGGNAKYVRGSANKTESAMPKDLDTYRAFVRDLATRYMSKGVHTYAIENEVNSPSFWANTPQDYITLTEVAAKELRSVDPSARIADAGMSSTSYGYGVAAQLLASGKEQDAVTAFNTYFERRIGTRGEQIPKVADVAQLRTVLGAAQGKRNLDYLAAAKTLAERRVTDIRQVHFYEPWSAVPLFLGYLSANTPPGTPIEAWEVGSFWKGADGTDTSRAADMVRTVAQLLAGGVRRVLWLPLATSATNRRGEEIRYGLLDPDGTVRPAGTTMSELVAASRGARVSPVKQGRLQGVAFDRGGTRTLAVWATQGEVPLTVGARAQAAQLGAALRPVSGTTVTIGSAPQLVQTSLPLQQVLAAAR